MNPLLYEVPLSLNAEIKDFAELVKGFQSGSVAVAELKARRVPFGVYEQRTRGLYMVRVRCAAGIITPSQLLRVAETARRFGSGSLHITTRQEIQIHDVTIETIVPVISSLAEVGLSTRGGGGNTVRNITAPWDAGISKNELFDVTPYAVGLTSALVAKNDSWLLPRKYKIAFSNGANDGGFATVNDVGFIARVRNGVKGFRVFVAGGMGRNSEPGHVLHDFIPAADVFIAAEAIKRLFSKHGNRKNKHAARLRYLWNTLGRERFIELYEQEKTAVQKVNLPGFSSNEIPDGPLVPADVTVSADQSTAFELWQKRYVRAQKQYGAFSVRIPLLFGMIDADKTLILAGFLEKFGDNTIRFTHDQNIALRNIPTAYLGNMFELAQSISPLSNESPLFGNAVSCAGASTCQLGICRSRGAIEATMHELQKSAIDFDLFGDFRLHISGCSNSCGQHKVADLGFFGKVGRKDNHSYPVYSIVSGARIATDGTTTLAETIGEINARDLPKLVVQVFERYGERHSSYASFADFCAQEGNAYIQKIGERYKEIPTFEQDVSYYRDWGDSEYFSLAGKGTGECSAGLYDLIELDLARVRELREQTLLKGPAARQVYSLALISARALLITKGVEAASDSEVFSLFKKLFIDEELLSGNFSALVEKGKNGDVGALLALYPDVEEFSKAVEALYAGMDNSLQFKPVVKGVLGELAIPEESFAVNRPAADLEKDLRGVACPMNFVKTKLALAGLKTGQVLEIMLDDGAPIDNVPKSVAAEGHTVLSREKSGFHWRVVIRKS
jgi:sulfite reductase (ferredoxin)